MKDYKKTLDDERFLIIPEVYRNFEISELSGIRARADKQEEASTRLLIRKLGYNPF